MLVSPSPHWFSFKAFQYENIALVAALYGTGNTSFPIPL